MKKSIVLLSALLSLSSFAKEVDREVTRTDKMQNPTPVMVGVCSTSIVTDGTEAGNQSIESTLPVTNCQGYKTYKARETGKTWNTKITPIAGTETFAYKLEDDTQNHRGDRLTGNTAEDILTTLKEMNDCNYRRSLLLKILEASAGQSKCKI